MSERLLHRQYQAWPSDPEKRAALAREIVGEHIVGAYDSWLQIASDMLFGGYRNDSTEEQRQVLDWIASLGGEERAQAFAFVRSMIEGVVYTILCTFDALGGSVLKDDVCEQLLLSVAIAPWNVETGWAPEGPSEVIPVNTRESREEGGIELHRLWFSWKERYSRWQGEQQRGE